MDNTLNDLIAELGVLREEKKRCEFELNQVKGRIAAHEQRVMEALDDQGLTESGGDAGKVVLGEAVYPQVDDWDAFHQWILENHYLHFLEKRAAVLAYREALEQNIPVPGVLPFTKRKLTFKET